MRSAVRVSVMWDGPWDDEPPRPPSRSDAGAHGAAERDDAATTESGAATGSDDWTDSAEPGRWYRPVTNRGKLILVITVAVVLAVTFVSCLAGGAALADLYSIDPFGLPLLR
jgi:hypothetical protein